MRRARKGPGREAALLPALALLAGLAGAGRAQPARKLSDEGAAALKAGNLDAARSAFERAYRAAPSPQLLYELGRVAQQRGEPVVAADLLRRALAEGQDKLAPEAQAELKAFLLQPLPPSAEVAVSGEDGALLLVDDHVTGALPLGMPLLVPAGEHRFRLERERRKVETRARLAANRPAELRFTLVPPVAVLTPTEAALVLADLEGVPEALRPRLSRAATEAAARERVLLLPGERLQALVSAAPELGKCIATRECQSELAQKVEARYVATLRVSVQLAEQRGPKAAPGQGAWRYALSLYDVEAGAEAAAAEDGCPACSLGQVAGRIGELTSRVVGSATSRPRGAIEVASRPPGAEVAIDGRRSGKAPVSRAAFPGAHEVRLSLPGHEPAAATAEVKGGETARVDLALRPLPPPPKAAPRPAPPPVAAKAPADRPIWRRWWFWTGIAVVAAGVTAGTVAASYGGNAPQRDFVNPIFLSF